MHALCKVPHTKGTHGIKAPKTKLAAGNNRGGVMIS